MPPQKLAFARFGNLEGWGAGFLSPTVTLNSINVVTASTLPQVRVKGRSLWHLQLPQSHLYPVIFAAQHNVVPQ